MTHVLTDAEIDWALESAWACPDASGRRRARAVEAAVLAKMAICAFHLSDSGAFSVTINGKTELCVPESTVRERERAAWDASQEHMWGRSLAFKDFEIQSAKAKAERDRRYPNPTPEPKVVTGPSGQAYRIFTDHPGKGKLGALPRGFSVWQVAPSNIPVEDAPTVAALMEAK